jgi:hypothetical protein
MELLLVGTALGLFLTALSVFFLKKNRDRPEAKLENWGVHFTPNTVYTTGNLDRAITAFVDSWTTAYPHHSKSLKRALKNLDIVWHSRRIKYKEDFVLALMESPEKINLWIGPRLKNGNRHLAYTGLFDQLGKLALLIQGLEPDTSKPEVRKILADARARMF